MAKLPRVQAKIFASKAAETDIGQFGSALTGTKVNTGDIAEIQALPAYEEGWRSAVISNRNYPTLQEMNGVQKTFSQHIAYFYENGIPEWDANTTYYANTSFCQVNGVWYQSVTDNNIGNNPAEDQTETNWKKVELGGGGSGQGGFNLFDPVIKDHVLSFEESKGLALLGTYVYKTGVAGSRYGYPDFVAKCIEEKNAGTATQVTLGDNTITMYINANGHQFYNIADKAAVDAWFDIYGIAWYFGVDEENERIFLPRGHQFLAFGNTDALKTKVFGTGKALMLTNGTTIGPLSVYGPIGGGSRFLYSPNSGYVTLPADTGSNAATPSGLDGNDAVGVATSTNASGLTGTTDLSSNGVEAYVYMVVGNTSEVTHVTTTIPEGEALNQIYKNKSDITDLKDKKVNIDGSNAQFPYITETYVNGTSGYNVYSNGYCEQWGQTKGSGGNILVTLLKTFKDIGYNINATSTDSRHIVGCEERTVNTIKFTAGSGASTASQTTFNWVARGYLAEGEY